MPHQGDKIRRRKKRGIPAETIPSIGNVRPGVALKLKMTMIAMGAKMKSGRQPDMFEAWPPSRDT